MVLSFLNGLKPIPIEEVSTINLCGWKARLLNESWKLSAF
ncbi:hypothetical protein ADICYQ_1546 [Cyclobacterium qasimii M12-11B]|uniref:Uncharacterized protein n=1 Tax=Cyclobacterium qasimii M12-11B TaxID=641524 RepID=S7WRS8_9BACT|nr:hypothetical protein ADICYQ_1546 [Cyclobacterium qasimii M12-11B]